MHNLIISNIDYANVTKLKYEIFCTKLDRIVIGVMENGNIFVGRYYIAKVGCIGSLNCFSCLTVTNIRSKNYLDQFQIGITIKDLSVFITSNMFESISICVRSIKAKGIL